MSQLATFTEFYQYFSDIATSHVDINGFKFGEKEIVQCGARSNMTLPALWAEAYDPATILDNRSDNHTGQLNNVIYIMDKKPKTWADQRSRYDELEAIVRDILGKVLQDYNAGDLQAEFQGFRYGWSEFPLGANEMLACRLDLRFLRPERLVYNQAKWS
jgi:hypothetical protein